MRRQMNPAAIPARHDTPNTAARTEMERLRLTANGHARPGSPPGAFRADERAICVNKVSAVRTGAISSRQARGAKCRGRLPWTGSRCGHARADARIRGTACPCAHSPPARARATPGHGNIAPHRSACWRCRSAGGGPRPAAKEAIDGGERNSAARSCVPDRRRHGGGAGDDDGPSDRRTWPDAQGLNPGATVTVTTPQGPRRPRAMATDALLRGVHT
jgi:hypothetical protein